MTSSTQEQIQCIRREIGMRERVYPKWIAAGRMKADVAAQEIATMRDVLQRLQRAAEREETAKPATQQPEAA